MVDYSKLSDFEINCEVAKANNWTSKSFVHEIHSGKWNPCQNAGDAWPIIVENEISIMWMTVEQQWCATALGELEEECWEWSYCPDHYFGDSNPLRAAMIVFLMMQEEK